MYRITSQLLIYIFFCIYFCIFSHQQSFSDRNVHCIELNNAEQCGEKGCFRCLYTNCIVPLSNKCNGVQDCPDKSDEENCEYQHDTSGFNIMRKCNADEYICRDGSCIKSNKFCDKVEDCDDASDEYDGCDNEVNILTCGNEFRCKDKHHCIRKEWVCDGKKDCPDSSDEFECENKIFTASDCHNENNRYLCENQRCISLDLACNGKDNCGDGSDEDKQCANIYCTCVSRNQKCKPTPNGPVCACQQGYKLQNNNTCIDIDECQIYGKCDHGCVNTIGSYECNCKTGFSLDADKRTCIVNGSVMATMLFSYKQEMRITNVISHSVKDLSSSGLIDLVPYVFTNNTNVIGIAANEDYIYWGSYVKSSDSDVIMRSNGDTKHEVVVGAGIKRLSALAVDWITHNIYFADERYSHIGVCNNNGTYCTILMDELNEPTGFALLPTEGTMYWCSYRNRHIAMADMDGKNKRVIISKGMVLPVYMTIDYPSNRLYWINIGSIQTSRLDGTDLRMVVPYVAQGVMSIAIFENKLYWSSMTNKGIQYCDKFTGKNQTFLFHADSTIYNLHIYHPAIITKFQDPCLAKPCSELCVLNKDRNYTCACTAGKKLSPDNTTCQETENYFVIIAGNVIINYYHRLFGKPKVDKSFIDSYIVAMTYDPLSGNIYASERNRNHIIRYNPITGDIKDLFPFETWLLGGMAFDYIGNNLYLSNVYDKTIEIYSLTTMNRTVFYFDERPYSIALIPEEREMFVSFQNRKASTLRFHIDKMKMNEIGKIQTFRENVMGPQALYYNSNKKKLHYGTQDIPAWIEPNVPEDKAKGPIISYASGGDFLFYTKFHSNQLYFIDTRNDDKENVAYHMPVTVERSFVTFLHKIVIRETEFGCRDRNGNCSHVCLPSSNTSFICTCPPEMKLSADNRTCVPVCLEDQIKCKKHDVCIKGCQICNGIKDCPEGEDEMDSCEEVGLCMNGQFMCKNGKCIGSELRCNLIDDCHDYSDEENCHRGCLKNEYECLDKTCISSTLVCDGRLDCPDHSDELTTCSNRTCTPGEFKCAQGHCIPKEWKCDGVFDCPDGEDETGDCKSERLCSKDHFKCRNDHCISSSLKCNGINNCGDNSDEKNCPSKLPSYNCTKNEYRCLQSYVCLPKSSRCNGSPDCLKRDDEHNCAFCDEDQFTCENQRCISRDLVCNAKDDCLDNSDEKYCIDNWGTAILMPNKSDSCEKNNTCQHLCNDTPKGKICECRKGYRLAADKISCEDENECELDICSQHCTNIAGSYRCSCYDGYFIRSDRLSCKAAGSRMEIITATYKNIISITSDFKIKVIHPLLNTNINNLDAIDGFIYWNDKNGPINRLNIKTKEIHTIDNVGNPHAFAVDWITNNIYFNTNDQPNEIKVCNFESKCATLIKMQDTARISTIVLHPQNGLLFWSQITGNRKSSGEIYRADMMGHAIETIVSDVNHVSGMAIDYTKSRLYWSDSVRNTNINSSNLDGTRRKTFSDPDMEQPPLSINIYENSLYWLLGTSGILKKCTLYGNKTCATMDLGASNVHKHFAILQASRHPKMDNPCKSMNCDHICIPRHKNAKCILRDNKPISFNDTSIVSNLRSPFISLLHIAYFNTKHVNSTYSNSTEYGNNIYSNNKKHTNNIYSNDTEHANDTNSNSTEHVNNTHSNNTRRLNGTYSNSANNIYSNNTEHGNNTYPDNTKHASSTYSSDMKISSSTYFNGTEYTNNTYPNNTKHANGIYYNSAEHANNTYSNNTKQSNSTYSNATKQSNITYSNGTEHANNTKQSNSTYSNATKQSNNIYFNGTEHANNTKQSNSTYSNSTGHANNIYFNTKQSNVTYSNSTEHGNIIYYNDTKQSNVTYSNGTEHEDNTYPNNTRHSNNTYSNNTKHENNTYLNNTEHAKSTYSNGTQYANNIYSNSTERENNTYFNNAGHANSIYSNNTKHGNNTYFNNTGHAKNTYSNDTQYANNTYPNNTKHGINTDGNNIYSNNTKQSIATYSNGTEHANSIYSNSTGHANNTYSNSTEHENNTYPSNREHAKLQVEFTTKRPDTSNTFTFNRQSDVIYGTIIALLIISLLACAYFYYKRRKLESGFRRIRFHNAIDNEDGEFEIRLDPTILQADSEQHECVNPMNESVNNDSLKTTEENNSQEKMPGESSNHWNEFEDLF